LGEANGERDWLYDPLRPTIDVDESRSQTTLPLAGVRILDLGWVWAAPDCTMMLAFLGAEVDKVESSTRLDITRRTKPFPPDIEPGPNRSGYFGYLNQAKKSMGINLSEPRGKALVHRLAACCDVMISNSRSHMGPAQRLSLSGRGQLDRPLRHRGTPLAEPVPGHGATEIGGRCAFC
jgi:hypothetical protein